LGIRINSISLGNVLFDGSVWDKKLKNDEQSTRRLIKERVAMGVFGSLDDVANLALFLSSEVSKFTTGASYVLDGGQVHQ
jgi:3-oxoacyl-[acyl-carrier protein] reductase